MTFSFSFGGRRRGISYINTDKSDKTVISCQRIGRRYADDCNGEFANTHGDSAPDEERASAKLLYRPEGNRCAAHVDNRCDHGYQEGAVYVDGLEEGDVVVEDEVDTCPLLRGTLAYIYIYIIWHVAQQRAKGARNGMGWELLVNFELQTYLHHL